MQTIRQSVRPFVGSRSFYAGALGVMAPVAVQQLINNLFNAEYESNGYGYSYMDTWSGPAPVRIDEAYYFPQAPLNVLANVTVKF